MKKSTKLDDSLFAGACNSCGETYEANSQTDDLEGITFRCRKIRCGGQVTLAAKAPSSSPTNGDKKGIHRIC